MNPKSKRLFARPKTEYGNYGPGTYVPLTVRPTWNQVHLHRLLFHKRYSDYHLLKQVFDFQKQQTKAEWGKFLSEHQTYKSWMTASAFVELKNRLFNKIRQKAAKVNLALFTTFLFYFPVYAGDVSLSGRVVNSQGVGLFSKHVTLYLNNNGAVLQGSTDKEGRYVIAFTPTDIQQEGFLPVGYAVSNNYPNPFNPTTIINVTVPQATYIRIKLYNLLGQDIGATKEKYLSAGTHMVDVKLEEMNEGGGFAEGIYFARIIFDEKYSSVKKLLFIRNSQHAGAFSEVSSNSSGNSFGKTSIEDIIDSIYVNGRSILPTSKTLGVTISGNTNLGNIMVDFAFNVDGKVISTIRYNQPNNHLPNLTVIIDRYSTITDSLGNYSLQIPVGDKNRKMDIIDPSIWTRKKHLYICGDTSNVVEDVLTIEEFPDTVMNFMNYISNRNGTGIYQNLKRFTNKPVFYIVADTAVAWDKEFYYIWSNFIRGKLNDVMKGRKYPEGFLKNVVIQTGTSPLPECTENDYGIDTSSTYGNAVLVTRPCAEGPPPRIISCKTIVGMWPTPMDFDYMKKDLGHELASGLVYMPNRSNDLQSWYNLGNPNYPDKTNPTKTDSLILRYVFSRDTGVDYPDLDYSRSPKNPLGDS